VTVTVVQESPDERVGNVGNEERDFGETVVEQFVVVFSAHKTTQAIAPECDHLCQIAEELLHAKE